MKPASPSPSRKRITPKLTGPTTKAVAAEIKPQVIRMRAIHLRAPTACKARLLGTSARKYPKKNSPALQPNSDGEMPRSWFIVRLAMPTLTLSR